MAKHLEPSFRSPVPVGLAPQNESWELRTSRPGNTPECKSSWYINHLHHFPMKRLNSVYCMILTILLDSDRCVSHCKVYVTAFAVTFKWTEVIWVIFCIITQGQISESINWHSIPFLVVFSLKYCLDETMVLRLTVHFSWRKETSDSLVQVEAGLMVNVFTMAYRLNIYAAPSPDTPGS